ncbi:MAG: hypothetical protein HYV02_06410 [Deltaproteobacteria bacterium]|nr:hypothetical protein [Deltaproteobacteria bacterium]
MNGWITPWRRMVALVLLSGAVLVGCGAGTDVGNPGEQSSPASTEQAGRDDFVGDYEAEAATETDTVNTDDLPEASSPGDGGTSLPTCSTFTGATQAIVALSDATGVLLFNFFNYDGMTNPASGDVINGILTTDATGTSVSLACTGLFASATLTMTCEVTTATGTSQCELVLNQQ